MSAVGDVYSHPEVTTKDSSPDVNFTSTTLTTTGHLCMGEAAETAKSHKLHVSASSTKLLNSTEMRISCLSNQMEQKPPPSDVGRFIHIAACFHQILLSESSKSESKNLYRNIPLDLWVPDHQ